MDHIRHAPESSHHPSSGPILPEPWPATLQDVRVKQSDGGSIKVDAPVQLDFNKGITARLRAFRTDPKQAEPSLSYQIVPDNVPLAPSDVNNSAADDPLKHVLPGTVTVHLPDNTQRTFPTSTDARFDLTKGFDIRCSIGYSVTSPIGPMLNVDVTLYPES
jgi:hypothetical protein